MTKHKWHNQIKAWADGWGLRFTLNCGVELEIGSHWKIDWSDREITQVEILPDAAGFLPWYGGECPVEPNAVIEWKTTKARLELGVCPANQFGWGEKEAAWLPIYYRVKQPKKKQVMRWEWLIKEEFSQAITRSSFCKDKTEIILRHGKCEIIERIEPGMEFDE